MRSQKVDYDQIAPSYDRRFSSGLPAGVGRALLALARTLKASRILEVGCGTCHWLAEMRPVAQELYGLDASAGMLNQARKRKLALNLIHGFARQLPFRTGFFDLVFCVNAIHHFQEARTFVAEAFRVLRPRGVLAVVGMDPHGRRGSWYVYNYFEGTYETDLRRFPSWETASGWMAAEGFQRIVLQEVARILDHKHGREVLDDPFLEKNSCSQLLLLTDDAYAAGLERIEATLERAEAGGETIVFPSEISLAMLTGHKMDELSSTPSADA
jgi:ubiquinone/menaquinone biosynthesis C-methylase UbiE